MNQNNSHLIAEFFRYHREKLNYSLRGLVGDGKVVDLSSLSAFENGKKTLTDNQLTILFQMIGYDYNELLKSYDFEKEYKIICERIYLGEIKEAIILFKDCELKGAFNSLGCINFSLIKYVISSINSKYIKFDDSCINLERLYTLEQTILLKIAKAYQFKNSGCFEKEILILKEVDKIALDPFIKAWIAQQFGVCYGILGNYADATISLLDAKRRYGELLGFISLIQVNLNLGSVYSLTHSYGKAEEVYHEAYTKSLLLKESTHLLTKCFNSLCWLYFDRNEYDKVKKLLIDKPDELVESRNTYFILAWAYYKIGNYEESIKYCEEGLKKFSKYSYVCMIYEYIEKACKGIKTGQDALLRKIIDTEDYDNDAFTNKLFTYEIIDIYERRKNYEKAFKYAKKLLNR